MRSRNNVPVSYSMLKNHNSDRAVREAYPWDICSTERLQLLIWYKSISMSFLQNWIIFWTWTKLMITKGEERLTSGRGVGGTGRRRGVDGTGRLRLQRAEDARFARAPLQLLRERWLQQKFTPFYLNPLK